jgi:hypothetical protein
MSVDQQYLDCGISERGFARIRPTVFAAFHLLAFIPDGHVLRRILGHPGLGPQSPGPHDGSPGERTWGPSRSGLTPR